MKAGTVFRVNEPIKEPGYQIQDHLDEPFPLYGVIVLETFDDSLSVSWMYYYDEDKGEWRPAGWNWKPEHIAQFEEVQID